LKEETGLDFKPKLRRHERRQVIRYIAVNQASASHFDTIR